MNSELNKWAILVAVVCALVVIVDLRRIFLVIFKANFTEKMGYENKILSKLCIAFDSISRMFLLIIFGIKEFYRLNNMISPISDILENCMFVAMTVILINYFIVAKLREKYRVKSN